MTSLLLKNLIRIRASSDLKSSGRAGARISVLSSGVRRVLHQIKALVVSNWRNLKQKH